MSEPRGVLFFFDDLQAMEQLSMEERGRLFTALLEYGRDGDAKSISGNERFLYPVFKSRIDRDFEKYEAKCLKNKANAEKRWNATASDRMQSHTNVCESCQEEKEKEKKQEEEKENISIVPCGTRPAIDFDRYRQIYNELCPALPTCRTMTEKRKTAVRKFSKEFSLDQWREVCQRANASRFLTGENDRGWKADLDFLLRADKAARVLEGAYNFGSDRELKPPRTGNVFMEMLEEEKNG